ncbi:MAG: hypothetical protein AB7O59_00575 [Pirellulales bacterium]
MPNASPTYTMSILGLLVGFGIVGAVVWLLTRRRGAAEPGAAGKPWLRFSVAGLLWITLLAAMLIREYQHTQERDRQRAEIDRLQQRLDVTKLRADQVQQLLRDQIEMHKRQRFYRDQAEMRQPPHIYRPVP